MNRWALTLGVTAVLWVAYRGYAHWMKPFTQAPPAPPALEIAAAPLPLHPEEFSDADRYLTDTKWTQQSKFKIKHGNNGYFYFDMYRPEGQRVELKPFAMVVRLDQHTAGPPYVVTCESAWLTFERPFRVGGESPGRLIAAVLEGKFRITGPNALVIDGRDCRFEEDSHQLYSDHPLEFQYKPEDGNVRVVRGTADKLQIDFIASTFSPHGRDMPRVGDIESLTLRRNVEFFFRYLNGQETVTTRVNSAGPFKFDFVQRVATFTDQVEITRPTKSKEGEPGVDNLKAHWLGLQFDERSDDAPPPGSSIGGRAAPVAVAAEPASPLGKLQFRTLRAVAKGPQDPVVLRSTGANFIGKMHDLLYDALDRTVTMQAPDEGVRLDNGDAQLQAPVFRVTHDEAGDLEFVEALHHGQLDFKRPVKDGAEPQEFHALWDRRLTMQPQPDRGLMIVTLEGEARVIQPDGVGILCDVLTLDVDANGLQQARGPGLLPGTTGKAAEPPPAETAKSVATADDIPLRHALAEGHVAMAGPTFEIETSRLDVTFRSGRLPKGPTNGAKQTATHHPRDNLQLVTLPLTQGQVFASVPNPSVPSNQPADGAAKGGRRRMGSDDRWDVTARAINALVLQDPDTKQADLREVIGTGDVVIHQLPPQKSSLAVTTEPPAEPLTVTGQRLHLVNEGALDQAMHLTGAPAHLRQNGMHIEGNELFFDRDANTARVIGKGMLQAPVKQSISGEKRATPSHLDVHWLREMVFDGTIARFVEGVRTRLDDSVMRCDEMEVTLNRHVDFSAEEPDTEGLGIQNVRCLRGVEIEYYQWATPQDLAARAVGRAAEFQLRYDTGDFEARGGGRLEFWQENKESRVDIEPQDVARANGPVDTNKLPFQYTHVVFHDRIVGNMHKKNATLYDRVWVTHAPVERSTQVYTREELSRDTESAKNGAWMGCDELQISLHPAPGQERDAVQILGIGKLARVELEGRLFQANADTLSYDESTKLFTLRGRGNNRVSISRQEYPGAAYTDSSGQTIQFNPATKSISIQNSGGASGAP
jgi:hypothetical protein